jgi:hypothetical protein
MRSNDSDSFNGREARVPAPVTNRLPTVGDRQAGPGSNDMDLARLSEEADIIMADSES